MKVTWEVTDICPGRVVGKVNRVERHMIGYRGDIRGDARFTLNSLTDGLTSLPCTAEQMAFSLNIAKELPAELLP